MPWVPQPWVPTPNTSGSGVYISKPGETGTFTVNV